MNAHSILRLSRICLLIQSVAGCKVVDWRFKTFEELLYESEIVVIGTDVRHISADSERSSQDSEFHVSCVLKGDNQIEEIIRIANVYPGTSCWEPDMFPGKTYIVSLKRTATGYIEDHVNAQQNAAHPATPDNVSRALKVCGLQHPSLPKGVTKRDGNLPCYNANPKNTCSRGQMLHANFTSAVLLGSLTLQIILTHIAQAWM